MNYPWEALCSSPAVEPESPSQVVPALAVPPAVAAPGRRRPARFKKADAVVVAWLVASLATVTAAVATLAPKPFDCHANAERQAELRNLSKAERIELQRSCGVSKLFELETEAEARAVADRLNQSTKRMCITQAYLGNDGADWLVFCPQL